MISLKLLCAIVTILIPVLFHLSNRKSPCPEGTRLPPGPKGYPLLGNLPQLPAKHTWLKFHAWSRTYGRLTRLTLASRTHVLLSTEHDANALLRARGPIYSSREQLPAAAALLSRHLRLLFLPYGTRWRRGRKVMHDVCQPTVAARYEPVQAGAAAGAVAALLARPERYEQVLERYASGLVVRLGFGRSVAEAERTGLMRRVFEVGHTVERVGSPGQYLVDTLPMMMWLPEWLAPWKRELNRLHKRELGLFRELLDDVRAQMAAEKGGAKRGVDCWERAFLEKQDEYELTDNEGAYVIGGLFEAGSGTTAAAMMSWFLAMVLHPEEYRKVQEEVDRSVGESRLPEFEDMEALKTVRAVVKETLRWRPVTAGGVPHQLEKDDVYEGFFLPAGTNIHPNQWAIHRDPDLYPEPDIFKPSRWLEPGYPTYREPLSQYPNLQNFSAFGFGRRICPGQNVAERSLNILVARISWACDISKKRDAAGMEIPVPDYDYTTGFNVQPNWFPFELKARSQPRREIIEHAARQVRQREPLSIF